MLTIILILLIGISSYTLGALISGCSEKERAVPEKAELDVYKERIEQLLYDRFDFELGHSVNEIIKTLGRPKHIQVEKIKNFHHPDEIVDEIHRLYYDGLYVEIYKATTDNKEMLQALSVTSNRFKVKLGLNIGTTKTEIKKALGNPSISSSNDIWDYGNPSGGYPDIVKFFFENDRVTKIEWSYWID